MNYIPYDVRNAVVQALSGKVKYNGSNVPIYSIVPIDADYPYIEIQDIVLDNDSSQLEEEGSVQVVLEIVTGWRSDGNGYQICDEIEESIFDNFDLPDQVKNSFTSSIFVSSSYLKDYDGAKVIVRRVLRYQVYTQAN